MLFMNGTRLVARVNHANIVQVFAVGKHRDLLSLIMESVEGALSETFWRNSVAWQSVGCRTLRQRCHEDSP